MKAKVNLDQEPFIHETYKKFNWITYMYEISSFVDRISTILSSDEKVLSLDLCKLDTSSFKRFYITLNVCLGAEESFLGYMKLNFNVTSKFTFIFTVSLKIPFFIYLFIAAAIQ